MPNSILYLPSTYGPYHFINISSKINSNEYEWDTPSKGASMIDMEVDVIQSYSIQPNVVDESSVGTNESGPLL